MHAKFKNCIDVGRLQSAGTGKTVMVLSLILATLSQLPEPEESIVDIRPVLSPLAFRHFTSQTFIAARKRGGLAEVRPKKAKMAGSLLPSGEVPSSNELAGARVPTLVETLLHNIRTSPHQTLIRDQAWRLGLALEDTHEHLYTQLEHNFPFYHEYCASDVKAELSLGRSPRKAQNMSPRTVYLSPATLVIVPPNLVAQWQNEILKHCFGDTLRVLQVRRDTDIPSAKALAFNYDVCIRLSCENRAMR